MRPSSRRRVAAWLLALPSGRGEECARRGRLEMISFWLLCWKLLRATAGLRRTTPELTDGSPDDSSPGDGSPGNGSPGNGSPGNDDPVSDSPTPAPPADSVAMEISSSPPLTDNLFGCRSPEEEEEELHYPEGRGAEEQQAAAEENGKGDECDYLVFEIGEKGRERGGESEGGGEEAGGCGGRGETEGEDEGRGEVEGEEDGRGETEGETEDEERGKVDGEDGSRGETEVWGRREVDGEDEGRKTTEGEDGGSDGGRGGEREEDGWMGEMKDDTLSDLLFITDSSSAEPPADASDPSQAWSHDLGNRDDLSDGHLSDCLQAELAIVYSDSDAGEDQWAAFAPGDVTGGRAEGEIPDSSEDKEARGGDEKEAETRREEPREQERKEDEEQMRTRRDLFLRSPSASSTASSIDPDRRVPADFSVHQDTLSEHVSTEHVDFLLARQQWRKMEEEVKGRPIPKPGLRAQGSFQGTHTSLYPPTRSPRLKHRDVQPPVSREPPLSSTMSPSSEDSGLDESSYRGPLEEPETAVEREIRMTLEREERHRRERGMIAQGLSLPRPSTLQTGRSPPRPPACRTPTLSISPSPSCSSSLPRSVYHEMTANNVIILEPDSSSSSGSSSRSRLLTAAGGGGGLSDWPAGRDANVIVVETSNLIIRSASEFCLSSAPVAAETQESTFTSNPFFKLRSLSSQSLVEQEIRLVRQREEEWRKQREEMWRRRREEEWRRGREEEWRRGRERYDTVLVSPGLNENISFNVPEVLDRSVSSPSSPSRTRKMERSSLSCDHKFPPSLSSAPRRQNAMAQRWEASLSANQKKD